MVVPKAGQSEKKMVYNEITWRIEEGGPVLEGGNDDGT